LSGQTREEAAARFYEIAAEAEAGPRVTAIIRDPGRSPKLSRRRHGRRRASSWSDPAVTAWRDTVMTLQNLQSQLKSLIGRAAGIGVRGRDQIVEQSRELRVALAEHAEDLTGLSRTNSQLLRALKQHLVEVGKALKNRTAGRAEIGKSSVGCSVARSRFRW